MAKPLPVAAVVLPSESSMSVRSRTIGGWCVISALPPALSAIGPYASVASVMPSVESMPTAAIATPKTPRRNLCSTFVAFALAKLKAQRIATTVVSSGIHVEIMPSAMPEMITVAEPISACSAMRCVGLCSYEV